MGDNYHTTAGAVRGLARRTPVSPFDFLDEHSSSSVLSNSKTNFRLHFVKHDANGNPNIEALADHLADKVIDFCVPRDKINAAFAAFAHTRATDAISGLRQSAVDLFVKSSKSGEGGELFLFALLESGLGLPQLLCKMPLKTSTQMHVHGTDGIHASYDDAGVLHLYWGESKLHKSPMAALEDCFSSLAPFLDSGSDDARQRDIQLVHSYLALDNQELMVDLLQYFERGHPRKNMVKLHGAALVGFDLQSYPDLADGQISSHIERRIEYWTERIQSLVAEHMLLDIEIDLFCIPLPSIQLLRDEINASFGRSK
jgi:hypothetical protein